MNINELLRLRWSCSETKYLVDSYLSKHQPSRDVVVLDLHRKRIEATENEKRVPLEDFLQKDSESTIRMPVTHFELMLGPGWCVPDQALNTAESFENSLIGKFLEKYGNQVENLHVHKMILPMVPPELKFYSSLYQT